MQSTPRLRVLSDRIPRVLMFIYFCRGLSGNMKRRPTCRVNDGEITQHVILLNLEDSRSHRNKGESEPTQELGARPLALGARPELESNRDRTWRPSSTASNIQGKPCDQGRFDPTAQIHLNGLYKRGPWPLLGRPQFIIHYHISREGLERGVPRKDNLSLGRSIQCESRISSTRLREIEWRRRSKEARPVGDYSEVVPAGSSSPNPRLVPRIL